MKRLFLLLFLLTAIPAWAGTNWPVMDTTYVTVNTNGVLKGPSTNFYTLNPPPGLGTNGVSALNVTNDLDLSVSPSLQDTIGSAALGITNVTGNILTLTNRMAALTASALSNALYGVYSLAGHIHQWTAIDGLGSASTNNTADFILAGANLALNTSLTQTVARAASALQAETTTLQAAMSRGSTGLVTATAVLIGTSNDLGGDVTIQGGDGTMCIGGSIILKPGNGVMGGTDGAVVIKTPTGVPAIQVTDTSVIVSNISGVSVSQITGAVSNTDPRVVNATTNVSGGILTWANGVISLTSTAISNAMAGVYQLAGNYWSKGDSVTNAVDATARGITLASLGGITNTPAGLINAGGVTGIVYFAGTTCYASNGISYVGTNNFGGGIASIPIAERFGSCTYSGTNIISSCSTGNVFQITLTNVVSVLNTPTNVVNGTYLKWTFTQGTGTNELVLSPDYVLPLGVSSFSIATNTNYRAKMVGDYEDGKVRVSGLMFWSN